MFGSEVLKKKAPMKKSCEGFRCLVNWKKRAYFGSCCENKLKSKEKVEAAICSFGKLAFFQNTQSYSVPLMKRPTIRLFFFPKTLLQKSLPNTLLIYLTAAYSYSSFFSKHSNTKPALNVFYKKHQLRASLRNHFKYFSNDLLTFLLG